MLSTNSQLLTAYRATPPESLQHQDRPPQLPPRGPDWVRRFSWWMLRRFGWDVRGSYPDAEKFLVIAAPHSSNFDWYWGMYAQWALGVRFSYMIKRSFFFPPLSWVLRWMGGIPVNRAQARGLIRAAIEAFKTKDRFVLLITPEGRTKPVRHLKRGFYEIAKSAGLPVLVVSFRYDERVISLDGYLDLSGDFEAVAARLQSHYGQIKGRHRGYLSNLENWAVKPLSKDTSIYE